MSKKEELVTDEKLLHDIVSGNLIEIIMHHSKASAQKALPAILKKALLGTVSEAELMSSMYELAETLAMIQDIVTLIREHVGLSNERVNEINNLDLSVELIRKAISVHPIYGPLMARAEEVQTTTSEEKLAKAMESTDPEVIFRNIGPEGFQL